MNLTKLSSCLFQGVISRESLSLWDSKVVCFDRFNANLNLFSGYLLFKRKVEESQMT